MRAANISAAGTARNGRTKGTMEGKKRGGKKKREKEKKEKKSPRHADVPNELFTKGACADCAGGGGWAGESFARAPGSAKRGLAGRKSEFDEIQFEREFVTGQGARSAKLSGGKEMRKS